MTEASDVDDLVGQLVEDRYQVEALLGAGGMGSVYRARHIKLGREVAIKVLHDHFLQDPVMVERFDREAAIAAKLDHQNLIRVIDVGETATKQKLMVLELARGTSLGELIAQGPMAPSRIVRLVTQLLAGLDHAHAAGLVHRDLKPDNIIVELDDHGEEVPKIVDFGIAVLREDLDPSTRPDALRRLTVSGLVLGTPQYMAPEQARGTALDPRCDLFALGVIMYELLAGTLPFDGTGVDVAIANLSKDPPAIGVRAPGVTVDPLLEEFMRRLMARRAGDRFASARVALDVLELVEHHRDAAAELLCPAPKPSIFPSANTLASHAAMAETMEVPKAAPRSRQPRASALVRTTRTLWHPWKSYGLMLGASLAGVTLAIVGMTAQVEPQLPSVDVAWDEPVAHVAQREAAYDVPLAKLAAAGPNPTLLAKRFAK